MKHSLKIMVGSLALAALTACGGGGGGGGSSTPADPNAAYGVNGVNQTMFNLGRGVWSGNVIGQNVSSQQYQMFMYMFGRGQFTTLMNVRIWSGRRGILPETMGFSINNRNSGGDGFANGNGFLINNYSYNGYVGGSYYPGQAQCFAYPCNPAVNTTAQGTPTIQIVSQFTDACHNTMTVQVRYQGIVVLSGTITSEQPVQFQQMYNGYPYGYPGQPVYTGQQIPQQCYFQQQPVMDPYGQNF